MATFWLNSNGSNTAPYDTKEKGAHTIEDIRTQTVIPTDTIMVARGSVTTDAVFNGPACNVVCNIVAEYGGIEEESTRPIINYTVVGGPFFAGVDIDNNIQITGIKFVSTNPAVADFVTTFTSTYKLLFTDCIIIKPAGTSGFVNGSTPFDLDRCLIKSDMSVATLPMSQGASIKSSTIIVSSDQYFLTGIDLTLTDVVVYLGNASYSITEASTLSESTITNCIWYSLDASLTKFCFTNLQTSVTNLQNINPKVNTTSTFRYDSDSPALGTGTILSNIGWDQLTQKQTVYYWLNPKSKNPTPPYASKKTGAHTIHDLRANTSIREGDTCIVARGTTTIESQFYYESGEYLRVFNIEAEDDGYNCEDTRPIIEYTVENNGPFFYPNADVSVTITGIKYISHNKGAPDFGNGGSVHFNDCILTKLTGNQIISCYGSTNNCLIVRYYDSDLLTPFISLTSPRSLNNCTIVDDTLWLQGMPTVLLGDQSSVVDCVFYTPQPRAYQVNHIDGSMVSYANNVWYVADSPSLTNLFNSPSGPVSGTNIVNADPLFLETTYYTIGESSPAYGTGTSGTNMGWTPFALTTPIHASGLITNSVSYTFV